MSNRDDAVKKIIDKDSKSLKTIDQSLELVSLPATNVNQWKIKGLGLQQALLGLAELQCLRLSKLGVLIYSLEEKLLDPDFINAVDDPKMLFSLYRLVMESLEQSSEYVNVILKNTDWTSFESNFLLATADKATSGTSKDVGSLAKDLLVIAAQLQSAENEKEKEHDTEK